MERFRATGMAYMHFALDHPAHFAVMWRSDLLDGADPELGSTGEAAFTVLLEAVRGAQAEGWAPNADPLPAAYLAWSTVHGLASLWMTGSIRDGQERSFDAVAGEVVDLLGRQGPVFHPG